MLNNLNISEKLQTIAENVQRVYDAGVKNGGGGGITPSGSIAITENGTYDVTEYAEAVVDVPAHQPTGSITITENGTHNVGGYAEAVVNVAVGMDRDAFWDAFQKESARTNYNYAFAHGWDDDAFTPKYVVAPTGTATCMFEQSGVTFVDTNKVDFSQANILEKTFFNAMSLTDADIKVTRCGDMPQTFVGAAALETLKLRNVSQACVFTGTFSGCTSLKNLSFDNCYIAQTIVLYDSPLTHDSLINLYNALENLSASGMPTQYCVIGDANQGKLSPEEIAGFQGKGWTLA